MYDMAKKVVDHYVTVVKLRGSYDGREEVSVDLSYDDATLSL